MAYLDDNGLLYLWNKIKTLLAGKVDRVNGKGLSTNDYTTTEKNKLAGIAANANKYVHPDTHPATMIVEDTTHRFITDVQRDTWNAKVDKQAGKGLSTNDYTTAEKTKLAGLTNFTHPTTDGNKHVPATGTTNNGKALIAGSTAGTFSWQALTKSMVDLGNVDNTSDLNKPVSTLVQVALDGKLPYIEHGAAGIPVADRIDALPIGIHTYSTGVIITSESHQVKFEAGNGKPIATRQKNNNVWLPWQETAMFTSANKDKLFGIAEKANNYVHPDTHPASMIIQSDYYKFVSTQQINLWNSSASPATPTQNGQMSKEDKAKLDAFGAASTYALKADIVGMYKYKGSVADASKLPTTGQVKGDVYNIVAPSIYGDAGANVAWTGTEWDSLGPVFRIESLTNAQIDTICA